MNTEIRSSKPAVDGICLRLRPAPWAVRVGCAIAFLTLWPLAGRAQSVTATVAVGISPQAAAVNPVTNKIYVANFGSNNVTVIDGATNAATTVTDASVNEPVALAVNPVSNKIYVVNAVGLTVTVIGHLDQHNSYCGRESGNPWATGHVYSRGLQLREWAGSASFFDGSTFLGNVVLDGTGHAAFPTSSLMAGVHSITVAYLPSPSAGFAASTSAALSETVLIPTLTVLASSANPVTFGQPVTFTTTVSPKTGSGTPTATVAFFDGSTQIGTGALGANAQGTFSTSSLSAGTHSITAKYSGDTNFTGSTSTALTETINAPLDLSFGAAAGSSTSATVKAGQTAMYSLQLSLIGGSATDQLTVTVSCMGAPPKATCTGPTAVTVTQAAPAAVAINVSTTANGLLIPAAPRLRTPLNRLPILWVVSILIGLLLLRRCKQTKARVWAARLAFAAPVLLLAMMTASIGGGTNSSLPPVNTGTPPGTYTLTVTAASGNLTHIQQLTLTVQ